MNYINFIFENEIKKYQGLFESFCPPPLKVAKKTDLLKQCQTAGWLYYLIDGVVKVYITNYEGNEHIVDLMRGGTLIGMDCVTPGSRSVVSISALTDIRVLPFNMDILKKMLAKDPDFAFDLVLYYGKVLPQVTYHSGLLSLNNPLTRFANFLYLFIDTPSYQERQMIELTQEEIASCINASRAQITKMCRQFREEGIIQTGNRHIRVLAWDKLRNYCRF